MKAGPDAQRCNTRTGTLVRRTRTGLDEARSQGFGLPIINLTDRPRPALSPTDLIDGASFDDDRCLVVLERRSLLDLDGRGSAETGLDDDDLDRQVHWLLLFDPISGLRGWQYSSLFEIVCPPTQDVHAC